MREPSILLIIAMILNRSHEINGKLPLVINTWNFSNATADAWSELKTSKNPLNALVEGCGRCERDQCGFTVGFGGSPDETGETTLDAMIMDGSDLNVGAVADLREIKSAIKAAKYVLLHTAHTLLVGNQATDFAERMGLNRENLVSKHSKQQYYDWVNKNCQPNFWVNVDPKPKSSCGPYTPIEVKNFSSSYIDYQNHSFGNENHDTIGMIVIDENGRIFAGTSTNGANHKIPGRVGDSPIPGAGAYCNNKYGGAAATGNGDVMMRNLPSFLAVELMRNGLTPNEAANEVVKRMTENYPDFSGAVIVADKTGNYAAACNNIAGGFPFSVADDNGIRIEHVTCHDERN